MILASGDFALRYDVKIYTTDGQGNSADCSTTHCNATTISAWTLALSFGASGSSEYLMLSSTLVETLPIDLLVKSDAVVSTLEPAELRVWS